MTNTIKFFTSKVFDNGKFADTLVLKCNVRAIAVEGGVVLDLDALDEIPVALLPEWVQILRDKLHSPLHTRAATSEEIYRLETGFGKPSYSLQVLHDGRWIKMICGNPQELISQAEEYIRIAADDIEGIVVLDESTGELLFDCIDTVVHYSI